MYLILGTIGIFLAGWNFTDIGGPHNYGVAFIGIFSGLTLLGVALYDKYFV